MSQRLQVTKAHKLPKPVFVDTSSGSSSSFFIFFRMLIIMLDRLAKYKLKQDMFVKHSMLAYGLKIVPTLVKYWEK